jgi:hypothetical protein
MERFGKFTAVHQSGLQMKVPFIDKVAGRLSLKIQQLDVVVETKTKDDVFVKIKVSVQYKVLMEKVYEAFYKLDFPHEQITSYVFDVVRAEVPKLRLDDVFERKDDIASIGVKAAHDTTNRAGDDITPEKFVCFRFDGSQGLYIHPDIWHEGVFALSGTQRFFDQQGAVHARVSVDFAREFGCLLEAPIG